MSSTHGLVIASYGRGRSQWVTIWDLDLQEKFDIPTSEPLGTVLPDTVEIDRNAERIEALRLPDGRVIHRRL